MSSPSQDCPRCAFTVPSPRDPNGTWSCPNCTWEERSRAERATVSLSVEPAGGAGTALYLTSDDLAALGIDHENREAVDYWVEDGVVIVE